MDTLIHLAHLNEEDLLNLSEKAVENLAITFDSLTQESSELNKRLKSAEITRDEALNDLQTECEKFRLESATTTENLNELKLSLSAVEKKLNTAIQERDDLSKRLIESLSIANELEMTIKNLENDKETQSELIDRKISECEHLSSELKNFKTEAETTRQIKSDALLQLEKAKSEKALLELREARIQENGESIKQHTTWLEEQLHDANDKLLSIRRDTTERMLALENELSSRKSELENSQSSVIKLEDLVKRLTELNEDHIEKLKIRTDELMNLEELHAKELNAQKRLTELYKNQASEAEKKSEEMANAVTSMQEMLKQGHEHVLKLETEKTAFIDVLSSEKNNLTIKNQALHDELNAAKEIVDKFRIQGLSEEELRKLNPAVATTIASLKRGRSLTQIYSDYVQVVEERDLLKLDKDRLTEHVREMISQLEEKGPVLRSQQEAYFNIKSRVEELEIQLSEVQMKYKEARDNGEDYKRRAGYFQRQSARLKQSCLDMSSQVKTLLRELEVSRGTVIRPDESPLCPDSSSGDSMIDDSRHQLQACIAANKVIDANLVTYRSLSELQTQNQKLLLVARDLAGQLEARESAEDALATQVSEISAKVDVLSGEISVARFSATEARSEAQLAKQQRDELRSLVEKHSITLPTITASADESFKQPASCSSSVDDISMCVHPDTSTVNITTDASFASPANASKLDESLCSLHNEFKQYREDMSKTEEVYTTTIDKLRQEYNEAKILNQKLATQLDYTHEKFRTLEANVANYKQEISVLREMNARYTTSAAASDEALTHLREQSARTSDRLIASEVECRQLARQLEALRANEKRLEEEVETARRQGLQHAQLMHQLQSIQMNLEHRETSESRLAERRVTALETELAEVKRNAKKHEEETQTLNVTLQSELVFAQQSVKQIETELETVQQSLEAEKKRAASLNEMASSTTNQLSNSDPNNKQPLISSTPSADEDATISDRAVSSARLRELQRECDALKVSLEAAKRQCAEYQKLANEMEEHMTSLTKELEEKNQKHTLELEDKSQRCEFLGLQLNLEKKERQDLVSENMRLIDESNKLRNELKAELALVKTELVDANARKETALEVESKAKYEIEAHQKKAQEAREKYETELKLHSQDVELLMEARKVSESATEKIASLKTRLEKEQQEHREAVSSSQVQNDLWNEERTKMIKRNADANAEVNMLHEQILKLTEQIVSLRKLMDKSGNESFSNEEATSQIQDAEDFTHVLEYLRRQKSIAEAAEEAANAEVSRLHLRSKKLEVQVADLTARLAEERRASEVRAETSRQHASLMSQLEQVNILSESNRLLRQEREAIRNHAEQAQNQLAALRADIEPLRFECQELRDAKELLISEKRSLTEEKDLWKERCTRLVETSKRMDPDEYKHACNARDELQHRLQLMEEAKSAGEREAETRVATLDRLITELTTNIDQLNADQQIKAEQYASLEAQFNAQKLELEKKQTNIIKLREIGRKYRQETDELKRQISNTHANEANLMTTKEAMVAMQADFMNARAYLEMERERSAKLAQDAERIHQLLEQIYVNSTVASLTESSEGITLFGPEEEADGDYMRMNRVVSALLRETDRLRDQADSQREHLMRMRMIESQLTRAKREAADLRTQLATATSSAAAAASTVVESVAVQVIPAAIENVHEGVQTSVQTPVIETMTAAPVSLFGGSTATAISMPQAGAHSWVIRAAATVQPVQTPTQQPIPTTNSPTLNRQTAEIRPITNNVATVLPTPTTPEYVSHLTATPETTHVNIFPGFPMTTSSSTPSTIFGVGQEVPSFLQSSRLPAQPIVSHQFPIIASSVWTSFQTQTPTSSPSSGTAPSFFTITSGTSLAGKRTYEEIASSPQQLPQLPVVDEPSAEASESSVEGDSDAKRARSSIASNMTLSTSRFFPTNTTQIVSPMSSVTTTVQSVTIATSLSNAPLEPEFAAQVEEPFAPVDDDESNVVYAGQVTPTSESELDEEDTEEEEEEEEEEEQQQQQQEEEELVIDNEDFPDSEEAVASPTSTSLIETHPLFYVDQQANMPSKEETIEQMEGDEATANMASEEAGKQQQQTEEDDEELGDVDGEEDVNDDDEDEELYEDEEDDMEDEPARNDEIIILSSGEEIDDDNDDDDDDAEEEEEEEGSGEAAEEVNVENKKNIDHEEHIRQEQDDVESEDEEIRDQDEATCDAEVEPKEPEQQDHCSNLAAVEEEKKHVEVLAEPFFTTPSVSVTSKPVTSAQYLFPSLTFSAPMLTPDHQKPSLFGTRSDHSNLFDSAVLTSTTATTCGTPGGLFLSLSTPQLTTSGSSPSTSIMKPLFGDSTPSPGLFSSMLTSTSESLIFTSSAPLASTSATSSFADNVSKQKIQPIVWTDLSSHSRSSSLGATATPPSLFGGPPVGTPSVSQLPGSASSTQKTATGVSRRKNWGFPGRGRSGSSGAPH